MTDNATDNQTANNGTPTTKSNVDVQSQPPSVGPTYDRELVYAPDGKQWKEKFHGQRGRAQQLESEYQDKIGALEKQLEDLKGTVGQKDSSIEQLNTRLGEATERLQDLQALKDRVPELEQKARITDRYRALMEYPELLNAQVKDVVKDEDGEEHEMVFNPILSFVENTTLEGDALRAEINRLNRVFGAQKKALEDVMQNTSDVTEGAGPSPGEPVHQDAEYWEQQAQTYQDQLKSDPRNQELMNKMLEAGAKARELRNQS